MYFLLASLVYICLYIFSSNISSKILDEAERHGLEEEFNNNSPHNFSLARDRAVVAVFTQY
jgi:hypothetical protein